MDNSFMKQLGIEQIHLDNALRHIQLNVPSGENPFVSRQSIISVQNVRKGVICELVKLYSEHLMGRYISCRILCYLCNITSKPTKLQIKRVSDKMTQIYKCYKSLRRDRRASYLQEHFELPPSMYLKKESIACSFPELSPSHLKITSQASLIIMIMKYTFIFILIILDRKNCTF